MHHRYDGSNIPIEVLRTFIAVNDCGRNFSKAAAALGLTQPAVSAQIKRLQRIIGKPLFDKGANGTKLTEDGGIVLMHGRRIVAANDQLMMRTRPRKLPNQLRIGMPHWMRRHTIAPLVQACRAAYPQGEVVFACDKVEHLTHEVFAGNLDFALLSDVSMPPGLIYDEWWEQMYWCKAPGLALKDGEPIPLLNWPGTYSDRHATNALNDAGLPHYTCFAARDLAMRVAAANAGMGVILLSESRIPRTLEPIRDPRFPTLPAMRKGIYLRQSLDLQTAEPVARAFLFFVKPSTSSNVVSAQSRGAGHASKPSDERVAQPAAATRRASKG